MRREEILEIRLTLEIKAVSLAMPHWTEATFDDLEKLLLEAEACDSIDRWSDINRISTKNSIRLAPGHGF